MTAIAPITLAIETRAAPERAWAFISEPDLVASWFAEVTPLGDIGGSYRIDFGDGSIVEGRLTTLEPGHAFAHEWAWLDDEPRRPTLVRWVVEPVAGGGSRVALVHDGWGEAGADDAIRDDHEAYWSGYMDDLRDLLNEADSHATE